MWGSGGESAQVTRGRKRKLCQLKCAYFKITADFQTGHRSNSRRLGPYNSRHQVNGGGGCSLSVYYENIFFFFFSLCFGLTQQTVCASICTQSQITA